MIQEPLNLGVAIGRQTQTRHKGMLVEVTYWEMAITLEQIMSPNRAAAFPHLITTSETAQA